MSLSKNVKKNRQRQAEGIEVAKNKGVKFVRRKYKINADFIQVYDEWKSGFITSTEGMKRLEFKAKYLLSTIHCLRGTTID